MSASLLPRALTALVAATAVALPVAGCGSGAPASGGDAGADPAAFLPASASVYVEAQVQPEGDLAANAKAVAGKILRTNDPGGRIVQLLDQGLKAKGADYAKDIQPWLGKRIGLAVTGTGSGGAKPDVAAAVASKDDDAAKTFADRPQNGEQRTYRDVSYRYDKGRDLAVAVIDHAVVLGTERGFKSAVDARSGAKLADAARFKEARETVGTDGLGFLYADPARFFDLALGAAGSGMSGGQQAQAQALKGLLGGSGLRSIAAKLDVASDALRVDAAVIGMKAQATGKGDGPGAAAAVPADAWLSAGIGDVGGTVQRALAQAGRSGGIGGIDPATLLRQLQGSLGIDVQQDLLSWMGDAAVFVRGTSMRDLGGALIVHSKDPAASRRAIGKLRTVLTTFGVRSRPLTGVADAEGLTLRAGGLPDGILIAAKDDKFVIAYGRAALKDALAGGAAIGSTAPFKTAAGLLGGAKPSLFLDTPQLVKLLGSAAGSNPGFARAKPTLDAFGPAAAGASTEGDVLRLKIAVAVP
jgi:hypothetical protein